MRLTEELVEAFLACRLPKAEWTLCFICFSQRASAMLLAELKLQIQALSKNDKLADGLVQGGVKLQINCPRALLAQQEVPGDRVGYPPAG
jgi:hypothetical protein